MNSKDSPDQEPTDEHLLTLLRDAYQGKVLCRMALVDMTDITPFSDYKPDISAAYRDYFIKKYEENAPVLLHVYERGDKYIMSDDYAAYYMYLTTEKNKAACIIIDPKRNGTDYLSDDFRLPPPTLEVLQ